MVVAGRLAREVRRGAPSVSEDRVGAEQDLIDAGHHGEHGRIADQCGVDAGAREFSRHLPPLRTCTRTFSF